MCMQIAKFHSVSSIWNSVYKLYGRYIIGRSKTLLPSTLMDAHEWQLIATGRAPPTPLFNRIELILEGMKDYQQYFCTIFSVLETQPLVAQNYSQMHRD